jgi:hypothetical protein
MRAWAHTLAVAFLLALKAADSTGEAPKVAEDALAITLRADMDTYGRGGTLRLEVTLLNRSADAIALYGQLLWGPNAGLQLHVIGADGKEIRRPHVDHDFIVPSSIGSHGSYLKLPSGHYFGTVREIPLSQLVPEPGDYQLVVDYLSPAPAALVHIKGLWPRERGTLRSPPLLIRVLGTGLGEETSPGAAK